MTTTAPQELLEPLVVNAGQLYSLPSVAMEVLKLTSQPYLDTRLLKACLENDPALTTRILKVVNSSIFGLSRKVTDLSQALGLLGIKPLKMLVLGFSLPKELWEGVEAETVTWYWRHTLVKAVAARELAAGLFVNDGDEAFLAGLLQDIGILVLIQQLGSPYLALLAEARGDPEALRELERQTLGFDHISAGSLLLDCWGLPPSLVNSVQFPHERFAVQKMNLPERTTAQVLHLAHLLSTVLDNPAGPAMGELLEAGQAYCRLTIEDVKQVISSVQAKVNDLAGILKLELDGGQNYADLVAAAHDRLADVAAAAGAVLAWRNREGAFLVKTSDLRQELLQAAVDSVRGVQPSAKPAPGPSIESASRESTANQSPSTTTTTFPLRPSLGGNPLLVRRVTDSMARCRAARTALSLAIAAIDDFAGRLVGVPGDELEKVVSAIASGLTIWTEDRGPVWHLENGRFALLWEGADRNEGVELIRHALNEAGAWSAVQPGAFLAGLTFSAGVATLSLPSRNFPPQELIEGAERCLSGAILSGGNTVKTIEL